MRNAKSEISETHDRAGTVRRRVSVNKSNYKRRYPIGAELIGENETHFRVWAPKAKRLDLVLEGNEKSRDTKVPPTLPHFSRWRRKAIIFRELRLPAREAFIGFASMKAKVLILILPRVLNLPDRTVLPAWSIRFNLNGRMIPGAG